MLRSEEDDMPLRDHFHPPLSERRPWESFHSTWASALADYLNQEVLTEDYIALENIHAGAPVEIDVATFAERAKGAEKGAVAVAPAVWAPATAPVVWPATFPEGCTVEIKASDGSRTLVAAIELVSPGNKDRDTKRRLFAAKCATHLQRGVGLIVVDVVTNRQANLHNDLIGLLQLDSGFRLPDKVSLYTVAYRPLLGPGGGRIETWPMPLEVGRSLPTVPLSLAAELCVAVDLEPSYQAACERRRLDEVE
jgi:hypothetical protein